VASIEKPAEPNRAPEEVMNFRKIDPDVWSGRAGLFEGRSWFPLRVQIAIRRIKRVRDPACVRTKNDHPESRNAAQT
jgi:hypothetical protein